MMDVRINPFSPRAKTIEQGGSTFSLCSVDKTLLCYHSNEDSLAPLSHGNILLFRILQIRLRNFLEF